MKAVGEGSRRVQSVPVGTWLLAEGPYGALTGMRRKRRAVLLIADVVFRAELDEIAQRRQANVIYLVGRSSDPANAVTSETLGRLVPELQKRDVFLCASPCLAHTLKAALRDAGLPREQLHEQDFSF